MSSLCGGQACNPDRRPRIELRTLEASWGCGGMERRSWSLVDAVRGQADAPGATLGWPMKHPLSPSLAQTSRAAWSTHSPVDPDGALRTDNLEFAPNPGLLPGALYHSLIDIPDHDLTPHCPLSTA